MTFETFDSILAYFFSGDVDSRSIGNIKRMLRKRSPDKFNEIEKFPGDKFVQKLYNFLNNISVIPTCDWCKKRPKRFNGYKNGYDATCSKKCKNFLIYGVDNPMKSKSVSCKPHATYQEKTGYTCPADDPSIQKRAYETRKINGTIAKPLISKIKKEKKIKSKIDVASTNFLRINGKFIICALSKEAKEYLQTEEGILEETKIKEYTKFLDHLNPDFLSRLSYFLNNQSSILKSLTRPSRELDKLPFPLKLHGIVWNNYYIREGSKSKYFYDIFKTRSLKETIEIILNDPNMSRNNMVPNIISFFPFVAEEIHKTVPENELTIVQKIKKILYGPSICKRCNKEIQYSKNLWQPNRTTCVDCRYILEVDDFTYVDTNARDSYDSLLLFLDSLLKERTKLSKYSFRINHPREFNHICSWCIDFAKGHKIKDPLKNIEIIKILFYNKGPKHCPVCGKIILNKNKKHCSAKCNMNSPELRESNRIAQHLRNIDLKEKYFRSFQESEYLGMDEEFKYAKMRCKQSEESQSCLHISNMLKLWYGREDEP